MKLAWLCYDEYSSNPEFLTEEPESWRYGTVIPIVYAEIQKPEQN